MAALALIQWWYGRGWSGVIKANQQRLLHLADMFSVEILVRTMFAPWKRIITYPGAGLDAHLRAWVDNLVSRVVGFFIRSFVLFSAAVAVLALSLLGVAELVFWPLAPLAGVALIIWGLT